MTLSLKKINNKDFDDIYNITTDDEIMKWVGNRRPWTEKKVKKFICYNKKKKNKKIERYFTGK